ncbi:MAG: hypothetical protein AVO35_09425 [Candidatus Aegiribacteria sp. MLS_C]|nr:MAG: hypothetical protein AVO35_09425 [Candidatus Aegiribacteria sp. MLS_C]
MTATVIVLLGLLLVEELIYRLSRGKVSLSVDLAGDTVEGTEKAGGNLLRVMSWARFVQLLVFGLLLVLAASSTGVQLLNTPAGQLSGLLLLTQVVRIVNRKIINQWSVLGMTVVLQVLMLLLMLITGADPTVPEGSGVFPGRWMISMVSFSVFFLLTVTVPFCATYFLRLLSREDGSFFYFLPSLVYSEYWIRRLTRFTAALALALFLSLSVLVAGYGYPLLPAMMNLLTVLLLLSSLAVFRDRMMLHHTPAVALVSIAWLLRLVRLLVDSFTSLNVSIG